MTNRTVTSDILVASQASFYCDALFGDLLGFIDVCSITVIRPVERIFHKTNRVGTYTWARWDYHGGIKT
jgi:hypothetical protein